MIGFSIICDSVYLTFATMFAWSSMVINRWIIPRPPFLAIPTAISYSVTVSIGDETIGILRGTFLENREFMLMCYLELTSEYWGTSNTSSNVRPKGIF